jgi:hypothetical protein
LDKLKELQDKLQNGKYKSRDIESTILCLGFSQNHDANFLNKLAQAGSNIGNFVYIDTSKQVYE